MPDTDDIKGLPPREAIAFLERKGYRFSFDWRDTWQQEHARAFTVAKAMRLDVLQTIRQEVDRALAEGRTFQQFKKDLQPRLEELGWWGRSDLTDPDTGEVVNAQLGSSRRLRIIYDTNLRTARAAGRWERFQRTKRLLPYLGYVTRSDERVRASHKPWHRLSYPVDHPFWNTHFPPNGWGCRCIVVALTKKQSRSAPWRPDQEIDLKPRQVTDDRAGPITLYDGIDKGFAYNPGQASMRALTPRPQSGLIRTPAALNKPADIPLPPARPVPEGRVLPDTVSLEDSVDSFLDEFGVAPGGSTVFRDRLGEPVVISDDFFRDATGAFKSGLEGRKRYFLLLADALKDPDEIWWAWERLASGEAVLRRRYFSNVDDRGGRTLLTVMDVSKDGWRGVTAFTTRDQRYSRNARGGVLAYVRPGLRSGDSDSGE